LIRWRSPTENYREDQSIQPKNVITLLGIILNWEISEKLCERNYLPFLNMEQKEVSRLQAGEI
jgi:hypothetical protein